MNRTTRPVRKESVTVTTQPRYRTLIAAATAALIAPAALVTTTVISADAAVAKHKHEVTMYKVEKNVKLSGVGSDTVGDSGTQSLSCDAGDYVLDGMWMVSHVDQYNPDPPDPDDDPAFPSPVTAGVYNDLRDVWVQASYPASGNFRTWNFVLANKAYGDAQLKLHITCIKDKTESNAHKHDIKVRDLFGGVASTSFALSGRSKMDSFSEPWGACSSSEFLVAPGFDLGTPNHRLVASYPTNSGRSWAWEFGTDTASLPSVNVYGRCIERRVFDGVSPKHAIRMKHMPVIPASGFAGVIPAGDPQEVQYSCDQDEPAFHGFKAMVGAFYMGNQWEDNWFLGMAPRPKTRVYSFWNHNAADADVNVGTLCINSRTGNPI